MTQEKATKRPWCVAVETEAEDGLTITIPVEEWEPDLANADLIVAADNEREALLSEVAELRQACKKALTCATLNSDVRALIVATLGKER
jgi:hypothetical protein